jgi:hypothetical protein
MTECASPIAPASLVDYWAGDHAAACGDYSVVGDCR